MALVSAGDIKQKYDIKEVVGKGSFAVVCLGINKATGEHVAVKILEPKDKDEEEMTKNEIEIQGALRYPNIIQLKEVFDRPAKVLKARKIYLVMEVVTGGELLDRIINKGYLMESEARPILRSVARTIAYLHSENVVHRDIKPGNVLFVHEGEDSPIKLADFGCATRIRPGESLHSIVGTPAFVAPELLTENGYGKAVDVWSFGVTMYIVLCGYPPFNADDDQAMFRLIKQGDFTFPAAEWTGVSEDAKDLIRRCLALDPSTRATAMELANHPWMTDGRNLFLDYRNSMLQARAEMTQRKFRRMAHVLSAVHQLQALTKV